MSVMSPLLGAAIKWLICATGPGLRPISYGSLNEILYSTH